MAYKSSLYSSGNIIGYTGDVDNNPTVYFQKGSGFGRITQEHENSGNIGRSKVRHSSDYKIYNDIKDGKAREFYKGKVRHKSRNKFIKTEDPNDISTLSKAIKKFQELKPKYAT